MRTSKNRIALLLSCLIVLAVGWNASAKVGPKINVKLTPGAAKGVYATIPAQNAVPSPKALKPEIHPTGMQAQSSAGCLANRSICIYVHGKGLHVDYIEGFLWPFDGSPKAWCGKAQLFFNAALVGESNQVCIQPGDSAFAVAWVDDNLPESSIVCIGFTGWSGRPCETVHS